MSEPIDVTPAEPAPAPVAKSAEGPDIAAALRALTDATRSARDEAQSGQRKLMAIAGGALVGALASVAITGVVGMRAIADLREAAHIQAAAGKIAVEQVRALTNTLAQAALDQEAIRGDIAAFGAELELTISESMAQEKPAAVDFAPITKHIDESLAKLREELMAAIAETVIRQEMQQGALTPGADLPKLAEAAPQPMPEPVAEAEPTPEPKADKPKPAPRAARKPAVDNGAFAYP